MSANITIQEGGVSRTFNNVDKIKTAKQGSGNQYWVADTTEPSADAGDVTFYDYDGSVVASYTKTAFASLTSMPPNPDRTSDGLTAQGWNWTLSDAKTYVAAYGRLNIGQMYTTTDGKTHVYIHIDDDAPSSRTTFTLHFGQSVANGVKVNWGDGSSPETYSGTGATGHDHTYSIRGDYEITLEVISGSLSLTGTVPSDNFNAIYGLVYGYNAGRIRRIAIGSGVTEIGNYAFYQCYNLRAVAIPNTITSIAGHTFGYCYRIPYVTIPSGVTSIGSSAFYGCCGLNTLSLPNNLSSIGDYVFHNCYNLSNVTLPSGVKSIAGYTFNNCNCLLHVTIPSGVISVGNSAFNGCYSLTSVTIPSAVTSMDNRAFYACYYMTEYHIKPTTPPTIGTNVFYRIASDCKIYVPSASVNTYKAASEWSTYASQIYADPT